MARDPGPVGNLRLVGQLAVKVVVSTRLERRGLREHRVSHDHAVLGPRDVLLGRGPNAAGVIEVMGPGTPAPTPSVVRTSSFVTSITLANLSQEPGKRRRCTGCAVTSRPTPNCSARSSAFGVFVSVIVTPHLDHGWSGAPVDDLDTRRDVEAERDALSQRGGTVPSCAALPYEDRSMASTRIGQMRVPAHGDSGGGRKTAGHPVHAPPQGGEKPTRTPTPLAAHKCGQVCAVPVRVACSIGAGRPMA
jgi:hypothetical protein